MGASYMNFPLLGNWRGRPVKIWGLRKTPSGAMYKCKQLFNPYGYVNLPVTEVQVTTGEEGKPIPALPAWGDDVDEFLHGAARPTQSRADAAARSLAVSAALETKSLL